MTPRILIIHTPSQLEETSSLVDLLEASLSLSEGAIACSSLPGYASSSRSGVGMGAAEYLRLLDELGAALVLVDASSANDAQLWFDAAAVWGRGLRLAVVVDAPERAAALPAQLASTPAVAWSDRAALASLVEDLAFDLSITPRMGPDAQRALDQLSGFPPPPGASVPSAAEPLRSAVAPATDRYQAVDTVPPPPLVPSSFANEADIDGYEDDGEEPYELDDSDVEPVQLDGSPRHSMVERRLTCVLALDAGRAIGECSFHRDSGGDFAAELAVPFGVFIDAAGGSWDELKRLGDVEVWLGATDNLLQALPGARRDISEWYEIGFQFSTLRSIAEQGMPEDAGDRAAIQEIWGQSLTQLRTSAASAGVAPRDIRRLQAMLDNLIGPEQKRDYGHVGRALTELREHAAAADRGELQMAGRAVG